jgi:hypothetical protein
MVDHVVCVIADHPAVVYLAGDLAADTRRRWRLGFVLVLVVLVLIVVVLVVVELLIVGGHDRLPVAVPFGVTEVASAPVWAQFPSGEGVPVQGPDVEGGIAPQVQREEGTPPAYLPHALWPIARDGRHWHTATVDVPPRREVYVRPRDGFAVGVEPTSKLDQHVDVVAQGPR